MFNHLLLPSRPHISSLLYIIDSYNMYIYPYNSLSSYIIIIYMYPCHQHPFYGTYAHTCIPTISYQAVYIIYGHHYHQYTIKHTYVHVSTYIYFIKVMHILIQPAIGSYVPLLPTILYPYTSYTYIYCSLLPSPSPSMCIYQPPHTYPHVYICI